ncbi:hypothetical protein GCM10022631_14410 [Deinococcus rubellus]
MLWFPCGALQRQPRLVKKGHVLLNTDETLHGIILEHRFDIHPVQQFLTVLAVVQQRPLHRQVCIECFPDGLNICRFCARSLQEAA